MTDSERGAWIVQRTKELRNQGVWWSKAMMQAREEAEQAGKVPVGGPVAPAQRRVNSPDPA